MVREAEFCHQKWVKDELEFPQGGWEWRAVAPTPDLPLPAVASSYLELGSRQWCTAALEWTGEQC